MALKRTSDDSKSVQVWWELQRPGWGGAVKTALLGTWLIQALRTAENEGKAGVWLVCWLGFFLST